MDISQSTPAYTLTRGMARAAGVNLIEAVTEGWYSRREYEALVGRCEACGRVEPCAAWLSAARSANLPGFCANKAEIEALRL